jgi:ribosomal protein L37AE/L43A
MEKEKFEKLKAELIEKRKNEPKVEPKWPYELFGIECGDGWKKLYQPIVDAVVEHNLKQEKEEDKIEIHQIKEKFGALRIFLSKYTSELRDMIDEAEEMSYNTCEVCGKYIKKPIVENHWIYPECKECHEKWLEKRTKAFEAFENKIEKNKVNSENSKDKSQEGGETED